MSARLKNVWHRCALASCRRLFRPYARTNMYCSHAHYARARRVTPEPRRCPIDGTTFLVGGSSARGRRRPGRGQITCSRRCAGVMRERSRVRRPVVRNLSIGDRKWFGAMIQGEGHVPRSRKIFLEIGNTDHALVLELQRKSGAGSIRKDRPTPGEQPFWRWRLGAVDTVGLLRQVIFNLGSKQRDAIRLLRVAESRRRIAGPSLAVLLRRRAPSARRPREAIESAKSKATIDRHFPRMARAIKKTRVATT